MQMKKTDHDEQYLEKRVNPDRCALACQLLLTNVSR